MLTARRCVAAIKRLQTRRLCGRSSEDAEWEAVRKLTERMTDPNKSVPVWIGSCAGVTVGVLVSQQERSSKWSLRWQFLCSVPLATGAAVVAQTAYIAYAWARWHTLSITGDATKLLSNRLPRRYHVFSQLLPAPALAAFTIYVMHGKAISDLISPWKYVIGAVTKHDMRIRALESKALEQDLKLAELEHRVAELQSK